jgi:hypothetical protein
VQTDFAYIDDAVTDACSGRAAVSEVERDAGLKIRSTRVVAGFHLHDPSLEDELVQEATAKHRAAVEAFNADRAAAKQTCADRGFAPLAVVPQSVWRNLCEATGLFRLHPSKDGIVHFDRNAFASLKDENGMTAAEQVEWLAENKPYEYLRRLFPSGTSFEPGWGLPATLVMPIQPADVAEVLLKARDLDLKVATVAEAISFKETPSEIYRNVVADREARAKALRDDPIIYFEQGTAVAIVQQFGDFPVEREIIDRILSAENLMRLFPGNVR